MPSPREVALWMVEELRRDGTLNQDVCAPSLAERFGDEFVYVNARGNLAISREVLSVFRELTNETAVWVGAERAWRWREEYDPPGRRA